MHPSAAVAQIDPDENERDPGDVGKVHLPLQQGRDLRIHGRPSLLGVRRASGSKRRTSAEGQSDQSEQRAKHDDSTHAQDLSLEESTL